MGLKKTNRPMNLKNSNKYKPIKETKLVLLILFISTSLSYSQGVSGFFTKTDFKWEEWEVECSDSLRIRLVSDLTKELDTDMYAIEYMLENINNFHPIDYNSDGEIDFIYSGFANSEGNSIIVFIYENGKYVNKLDTYGYVIEINKELEYLPATLKILSPPCCEDVVYSFESFGYYINNTIIHLKKTNSIKFLEKTLLPIIGNYKYTPFETTIESYNLRSSPEITDNVVSIYPKGSYGTAIYSIKDEKDGRVWWLKG